MKTRTEEIQYLGQMLTATTAEDTTRLESIVTRLNEIVADDPNVPKMKFEDPPPCWNCGYVGQGWGNGAWRCQECFAVADDAPRSTEDTRAEIDAAMREVQS